MKTIFQLLCLIGSFALTGCATTEKFDYTDFIASNPKTILVAMPTSESTDINAGPAVLASAVIPLSNRGYYVLPVTLVNDTFRYNGVTEAAEIRNISYAKLKEIYNADALLDINIEKYGNTYQVVDSVTEVQATARLIDLNNGKLLWYKTAYNSNASNDSDDSLLEMLLGAAIKHVINNTTDQGYEVAQENGYFTYGEYVVNPILYGSKSPNFRKDDVLNK